MASCTKIDNLVQAYIDDELGHSERVIFEQHLSECRVCAALLRRHQRVSAALFEVFEEDRLSRDLHQSVLENLPTMGPTTLHEPDVATVNWRAKHPVSFWRTVAHLAPAAVLVVLVLVAAIIRANWPVATPSDDIMGVVMHSRGQTEVISDDSMQRDATKARDFVGADEWYETGSGSSLMLTLAGPSEVRLNRNTRIKVHGAREISVEKGEVWLNIGRDGRLFRVNTPTGNITVFGTSFEVQVDSGRTTVTVEEGEVKVERQKSFKVLEPGQQSELVDGREPTAPREVDVVSMKRWADRIQPEKAATALFEKHIAPQTEQVQLHAERIFKVNTVHGGRPRAVKSIHLNWTPGSLGTGYCGYDLYVTDERSTPLFKEHIPAEVFNDPATSSYELDVPGQPIRGARVLHITVVPDNKGQKPTDFTNIYAIGI